MGRRSRTVTSPEFIESDMDDADSHIYAHSSAAPSPTVQYDENDTSSSGDSSSSSSTQCSPTLTPGTLPTPTPDVPPTPFEATIDKLLSGGAGSSKSSKGKANTSGARGKAVKDKGKKDKGRNGAHFLPSCYMYMSIHWNPTASGVRTRRKRQYHRNNIQPIILCTQGGLKRREEKNFLP